MFCNFKDSVFELAHTIKTASFSAAQLFDQILHQQRKHFRGLGAGGA
jgi:hypothetical protein